MAFIHGLSSHQARLCLSSQITTPPLVDNDATVMPNVRIKRHPELVPVVPRERTSPLVVNTQPSKRHDNNSNALAKPSTANKSSSSSSKRCVSMTRLDQLSKPRRTHTETHKAPQKPALRDKPNIKKIPNITTASSASSSSQPIGSPIVSRQLPDIAVTSPKSSAEEETQELTNNTVINIPNSNNNSDGSNHNVGNSSSSSSSISSSSVQSSPAHTSTPKMINTSDVPSVDTNVSTEYDTANSITIMADADDWTSSEVSQDEIPPAPVSQSLNAKFEDQLVRLRLEEEEEIRRVKEEELREVLRKEEEERAERLKIMEHIMKSVKPRASLTDQISTDSNGLGNNVNSSVIEHF